MLYTMRTKHARTRIILLLASLLPVFSAAAQEQSIRPGINRHFADPDWQQWVNTFERTGREVYDKRHAIVAASKVRPGMAVADVGAGTGLFTRLFAAAVEPGGTVYAIDISSSFIDKNNQGRTTFYASSKQGREAWSVPDYFVLALNVL